MDKKNHIPNGLLANDSGAKLEKFIANTLVNSGWKEMTDAQRKFFISNDGLLPFELNGGSKVFAQQVKTERSIYGGYQKIDFFLYDSKLFPVGCYIESKWQSAAGSVDEKYVFTVESMFQWRKPSILVIEGNGTRQSAMSWIENRCKKPRGGVMLVKGMAAFQIMVTRWQRDE